MNVQQQQINRDWLETFYHGLQELVDTSFPKTCPKCGKTYPTTEAFLTGTTPVRDMRLEDRSGLFSMEDGTVKAAVGLFRNCTCGTTIMADFQDRRDNSTDGQLRRQRFETLMTMLAGKGVSLQDARLELLKVLQGKASSLIDNLLGEIQIP